jgi:hypothetical protein
MMPEALKCIQRSAEPEGARRGAGIEALPVIPQGDLVAFGSLFC